MSTNTLVESVQLLPNLLLRAYLYVELGNDGLVSSLSHYIRSTPMLTLMPLRNLQATLINGGPRGLVWGILIVVTGALAQAASLAEMASAQPIAGAQYVCYSNTSTRVQLTTRRSTGLIHLRRLVNVGSSLGCKVGSLASPGSPHSLALPTPPHSCCRVLWQQTIQTTNRKLGTLRFSSSLCSSWVVS